MDDVGNPGENRPRKLNDESTEGNARGHQSMKSHRTVRLTVLPPLNGTTNTTVSHGGLIEVEQTHQTVEEAHREHMAKMMNLWKTDQKTNGSHNIGANGSFNVNNNRNRRKSNGTITKAERRISSMRVIAGKPMQTKDSRNNAVFAAVGAGMIPATMAMLLPMVLGKRRRRDIDTELSRGPPTINIHSGNITAYVTLNDDELHDQDSQVIRRRPFQKLKLRKKTQVVYY